jgi:hypothetical protein
VKEYAQAEGVLVELGVASELTADISHVNGVPEMAEYYEKVPCNSARPHVDAVLNGSVAGMRLMRADTCIEEHASGVWFPLTSVVCFITF